MIVWNEFRNDARVLKEAESLTAAGHRVIVHALHAPGITQEREVVSTGVEVVRVARSPFWRLRRPAASGGAVAPADGGRIGRMGPVAQALRIAARAWTHLALLWHMVRLRADVVHAHDVNTLPTAWLAARLSGARLVYDAHEISTSREGYSSFRKLVAIVEKALMPSADGTITTTEARAKFFARAYGIARPLVLQNRPREQAPQVSNRIRQELGLSESWPIVLYQGGVQQGRGLERLARVAAQVPDAYFVFIGGGRLDTSLRQIAQELQIEDRVRFIPTVALAELPTYTASADIGVQPIENTCLNHYTTDSNKLFEYVQAGLPVIASDLPEIRRIVRQHDLGLLVPEGDNEALADALRCMVGEAQLRAHHAGCARAAAPALSWEMQEHLLVELYRRILGQSKPSAS
ncbi:glycosyltransferase family 4 protein [Aquipseudomonas campi]|uniref:Glycosyltransferase family 4 protein n=1 Tax=Aquipseudomonas campi TaxID=2731681 RepID=A0ACD0YL39_9GAMM|nr:glycosyltransferase family 4 protein [Pseudomonas campi]QKE65454.2 glycosyltransferase family 4 protein [Pseudomonas campi]